METSQATQPQTGLLTWLLNMSLGTVFNCIPGAELAAQHERKSKVRSTRATKERYKALQDKRRLLSLRIRNDERILRSLDAEIDELKKQLNL